MSQTVDAGELLLSPDIPDEQLSTLWKNLLHKHEVHKCTSPKALNYFLTGFLTNIISSSSHTHRFHIVGGYKSASLNQFVQILISELQPGVYKPVALNFLLNVDMYFSSSYNLQQLIEMIIEDFPTITGQMIEEAFAETKHIYIAQQNLLGSNDDRAAALHNTALGTNDASHNHRYKVDISRGALVQQLASDVYASGDHTFFRLDHRFPPFRVTDLQPLSAGEPKFLQEQMDYFYENEIDIKELTLNSIHGSNNRQPVDFMNYMHGALAAFDHEFGIRVVTQAIGKKTEAIYVEFTDNTNKQPIVFLCRDKRHAVYVGNLKQYYESSYESPHQAKSTSPSVLLIYVKVSSKHVFAVHPDLRLYSTHVSVFELPALSKYSLSLILNKNGPLIAKFRTFPLALNERFSRAIVHYGPGSFSHFILGQLMTKNVGEQNFIFMPDINSATVTEHATTFVMREGKSCIIANVVQHDGKLNAQYASNDNGRKIIMLPDNLGKLGVDHVKMIMNFEITSNPQSVAQISTTTDHDWVDVSHTVLEIPTEQGSNIVRHSSVLSVSIYGHRIPVSGITYLARAKGKFEEIPQYSLETLKMKKIPRLLNSLQAMNMLPKRQTQLSALFNGILSRENTIVFHALSNDHSLFKVVNTQEGSIVTFVKGELSETGLHFDDRIKMIRNFKQTVENLKSDIVFDNAETLIYRRYFNIPKKVDSQKIPITGVADDLAKIPETKKDMHSIEKNNMEASKSETVAGFPTINNKNRQPQAVDSDEKIILCES